MDFNQQRQLATQAAMEAERIRISKKVPISAPVDPIEISAKCGCEVRLMCLSSLEGVYSPEPRPTIVLGSDRPAGRRSFTCAHELGHHIFKHGMRVEELNERKVKSNRTPEEFLADIFAGFLLMSQTVVLRALKDRGWTAAKLLPEQVYRLGNYFGVGYSTVVNHVAYSLKLIAPDHANNLLKVQPKQIKARYGAPSNSTVLIADHYWIDKTADLEVGDYLVLPSATEIDNNAKLDFINDVDDSLIYKAVSPGYTRAFNVERSWAVHIRISRKKYVGLADNRFLEESEVA